MKTETKKLTATSVCLDPDVRSKLESQAIREGVSLAYIIRRILQDAIKKVK